MNIYNYFVAQESKKEPVPKGAQENKKEDNAPVEPGENLLPILNCKSVKSKAGLPMSYI